MIIWNFNIQHSNCNLDSDFKLKKICFFLLLLLSQLVKCARSLLFDSVCTYLCELATESWIMAWKIVFMCEMKLRCCFRLPFGILSVFVYVSCRAICTWSFEFYCIRCINETNESNGITT